MPCFSNSSLLAAASAAMAWAVARNVRLDVAVRAREPELPGEIGVLPCRYFPDPGEVAEVSGADPIPELRFGRGRGADSPVSRCFHLDGLGSRGLHQNSATTASGFSTPNGLVLKKSRTRTAMSTFLRDTLFILRSLRLHWWDR